MDAETLNILKRAAAAPNAHPLAQTVVDLTQAALAEREEHEHQVRALQTRCDLAEEVVAKVKPVITQVSDRCERLEAELGERKRAERVAKSEGLTDAAQERAISALTKAATALVPDVELLCAAMARIKDARGRTIIQNRAELGHWIVRNANNVEIATVEKRSDAIAMVREMLRIERYGAAEVGGALQPEDKRPGRPTFGDCAPADWPADAQPGESWPRRAGRLDGRRIKTKIAKRKPRIL